MNNILYYGDHAIDYGVTLNPRLSTSIRIHVHPQGVVEVEVPPNKPHQEITAAVQKRARWIVQQLNHQARTRLHVLPREYVSGETHFYLGKRYQLKVTKKLTDAAFVSLKSGQIQVTLPQTDAAVVRRRLNLWYRQRAKDYFGRRLADIAADMPWVQQAPPLKLLTMRKQWGSCSPAGIITLNPWLIRAPRDCIDYVITHEVCHLQEHNHSKRYYQLLEKYFPGWQSVKNRLDGLAELLLQA